ncbi:glycosyl transferase [Marivirga lumbricoides]|uniref:Glycosyl transferase n=1 Tax=Marivirga lumbricoides TaxID=1046115 RepID=A0ABQ1MJK5_9BACT|nr:glycosyl transferase [Marivirga lumbricoides]
MEIKKSNIIILALSKWDGDYSSTTFSLASEFSKNNRVLYIDKPITWKDILFQTFRKGGISLVKRTLIKSRLNFLSEDLIIYYPSPVIPINFLPKGKLYKHLKQLNEKIIFNKLKRTLKKIDFTNYIYLNIFNPFFDHTDFLQPTLSIYYTVDNISESAYVKKHGVWLEPYMMQKAHLNFATSLMLKNTNEKYNKDIFYLPNAADLEIFDSEKNYDKPQELRNIEAQIITYIGHLDTRTNIEILKTILSEHDNKILMIVGPVSLPKSTLEELSCFNNILFVKPQPLQEIPAFLKYSCCTIIPFKCNELTKGIYPLKINEYLAMGLPVVSTSFSEDIKHFSEIISLANSPQDFSKMIDSEIINDSSSKIKERILFAKNNTWPHRVKQFWDIVERK